MKKKIKLRKATHEDIDTLLDMGYKLFLIEKEFEPLMLFSKNEAKKRYLREFENKNSFRIKTNIFSANTASIKAFEKHDFQSKNISYTLDIK